MTCEDEKEKNLQQVVAKILGEKVEAFEELLEIQSHSLESSEYQIGLYNGLVLGKSLLTGEEPQYYKWKGEEEDGERF